MEKDIDNTNTKNKKINGKVLVILLLFLVCASIVYYDSYYGKKYISNFLASNGILKNEKKADKPSTESIPKENKGLNISFEADSKSSFRYIDKGILHCTKDGLKLLDFNGNALWNSTFTMLAPSMTGEGNFTAVTDVLGRNIKVYGVDGELYSIQVSGSIIRASLNNNGYLAVITTNNPDYRVQIFNNEGTEVIKREEKSAGVYPVDVDISDDNKTFAVGYADTNDINLIGKVLLFYTFKEDGKDFSDSMYAAVQRNDELISNVYFMNENKLICVSDKSIFALDAGGGVIWEKALTNKISKLTFSQKNYIVLANGEELSDKEGKEKGTVEYLDLNGKVKSEYSFKEDITYLVAGKEYYVVGILNKYYCISSAGKLLWSYNSVKDIKDFVFLNDFKNVIIQGKDSAEVMKMKEGSKALNINDKKEN